MPDALNGIRSILVAGGGMSGLTAALEAAEAGIQVYIVEKEPYLGGRVARMHRYFPKLCPPQCGLEINFRRLRNNPLIRFFTLSTVEAIQGRAGNFDVTVRTSPRYVNEKCTACGACESAATREIPDAFNSGLSKVKSAYLPHDFAFPLRYVIAPEIIGSEEAEKIAASCPCGAIDLTMQPRQFDLKVGAVIWATGWQPYDATKIAYYGLGRHGNVVSNVMMERLASFGGPTGGRITRPSDGAEVDRVAFIQCAGSRDENHLPYCSGVCCMASLKQATYVLEQNPGARVTIFFIDIRTPGKYEDFYRKLLDDDRVTFVKGKPGEIVEDSLTGTVTIQGEDQSTGAILRESFDLVVLAAGMVPATAAGPLPAEMALDENGFLMHGQPIPGIIGAGCVKSPADVSSSVQDATAAALAAMQYTSGRRSNG